MIGEDEADEEMLSESSSRTVGNSSRVLNEPNDIRVLHDPMEAVSASESLVDDSTR